MSDIPASPKLLRLEAEIKSESDAKRRACLKAERAGFLGRQGYFAAAREGIAQLQKEFATRPDARVSAWINVAEGWIAHYEYKPEIALDKMRRAHALSSAMRLDDLVALSSAWLAQFAYNRDQVPEMAEFLRTTRQTATEADHAALSRFSLVFALAHHYIDDWKAAEVWYKKARFHASQENDEAALSAISYNMTYRRTYHLMVASTRALPMPNDWSLAGVGVETNRSYEALLNISSVGSWTALPEVMFFSATKQYKRAVDLYEANLDLLVDSGLLHQKAALVADFAWCLLQCGERSRAKSEADDASINVEPSPYIDDRVITSGRLAQVYAALGETDMALKFKKAADEDFQELTKFRSVLAMELRSLE